MSNAGYSSIQHLADALFLNHDPHRRFFVMVKAYTAYFDASGSGTKGNMLCVSGVIACVDEWKQFDGEWDAALRQAKIPIDERLHVRVFHITDMLQARGAFTNRKWKDVRTQDKLLGKLVDIIGKHVQYAPSIIVKLQDWNVVNQEYCLKEHKHTPLALAGATTVHKMMEWCATQSIDMSHVEFFFEDGDVHKGHLFELVKKEFGVELIPRTKKLTPLQACDLIAWETRTAEQNLHRSASYRLRPSAKKILDRIVYDNWMYEAEGLRGFCNQLGFMKRPAN